MVQKQDGGAPASPASLDMISGPLMRKKKAPVSLATALQEAGRGGACQQGAMWEAPAWHPPAPTDSDPPPCNQVPCNHVRVSGTPSIQRPSPEPSPRALPVTTHRAMRVLPEPGGPYSRMPLGGFTPMVLNSCGWRSGSSTSSRI